MKLLQVLDQTNSLEKNSFYKILNNLIENTKNVDIQNIIETNRQVKDFDNEVIATLFELLLGDFKKLLENELGSNISQLDIILDILVRDGNSILKSRWFEELYNREIDKLVESSKEFIKQFDEETKELDEARRRDYRIYRSCVSTAYNNDETNNFDKKITQDEYSILIKLADSLGLSNKEIRLINYSVVPLNSIDIDSLIKQLRDLGIIMYSKKTDNIYISDEVIKIVRDIRGKNIADKYYRRLLNMFENPVLNLIAKRHNISQRFEREQKSKEIINQGISLFTLLGNDIYKDGLGLLDKKKELNQVMIALGIDPKGVTIEDKVLLVINQFNAHEKDEKIGISIDGYASLCQDLKEVIPHINELLVSEFEFEIKSDLLDHKILIDHNLKPMDILDLVSKEDLKNLCVAKEIKSRGNLIENILSAYTDSESIYIENYVNLGTRDLNVLKINNININSAEIGIKYEDVTKRLFSEMGFNIDENLRSKINTSKDKIDILINLGSNEVIIVECKTAKSTKYNKFSACSRQIKSYHQNATLQGYRVMKTLLVAPDFTSDFVDECEMEIELNLSLITSEVLYSIWKGFKAAKHNVFPVNLLMRDALISDEKILKALKVK